MTMVIFIHCKIFINFSRGFLYLLFLYEKSISSRNLYISPKINKTIQDFLYDLWKSFVTIFVYKYLYSSRCKWNDPVNDYLSRVWHTHTEFKLLIERTSSLSFTYLSDLLWIWKFVKSRVWRASYSHLVTRVCC